MALGLAALALAATTAVRAEDPNPAAQAPEAAPAASSAAQVAAAPASAAAARQQHCWKEYRVGSNLPVTHCESADESEAERLERVRNVQNAIMRNNATAVRAPGGG
jgi:hypothetical protein